MLRQDGYFYFAGRVNYMIKSGALFVSPEKVENAIIKHQAVAEVAVIGVPDNRWGEIVMAIVSLKEGESASEEEIKEHCRRYLAGYQVPKTIKFLDKLPREEALGKVNKRELIKVYSEGPEAYE